MSYYQQNATTNCSDASTCKPDEYDSSDLALPLVTGLLSPFILTAIACWFCCRYYRKKELRDDAEKLTRIAPRNWTSLQRHDKQQRRLRSKIMKLFKSRWHEQVYTFTILNVGVVRNDALRQRYEQAYQTAQSAALPSYLEAQSAAPPAYSVAQSVEPPSYLEAVNMAYSPSNQDVKQTSAVSIETDFEPGVLRPGEMYLFYYTNATELNAVLESETKPAFSCHFRVSLGEFSSYGYSNLGDGYVNKYIFVVRAIIGADTVSYEPNPSEKGAGRTYLKSNLSEVLPEFLISCRIKRPNRTTRGGGFSFGPRGGDGGGGYGGGGGGGGGGGDGGGGGC